MVSSNVSADGVSVKHAVDLVKASLLYADTVEVLSVANQMIQAALRFARTDATDLLSVIRALDSDALRAFAPDLDFRALMQYAPVLSMHPEDARTLADFVEQSPGIDGAEKLRELGDVLEDGLGKVRSGFEQARANMEEMARVSGAAELSSVIDDHVVRLNQRIALSGDAHSLSQEFTRELKRYIEDPTKMLVVDDLSADLARGLIAEGSAKPSLVASQNANAAAIGTGMVARLPAFSQAPLDEIMGLRSDLNTELGRYRRKVAELRTRLAVGAFDSDIQADLDRIWLEEVAPAVADVREAMAEHSLVREILRSLGADPKEFVAGVAVPATLAVFSASFLSLNSAAAVGLTATPVVISAIRKRQEARTQLAHNDLFYLYEVNRRLGG